jgi:hypothetical protein
VSAVVDEALDRYVSEMGRRGIEPEGVTARTLAALVDVPRSTMSTLLQEYRIAQAKPGATRYVLACREYGRNARWRIVAKPGSDPKVVQAARTEQGRYIAKDAVLRFLRDRNLEVAPALKGAAADENLAHVMNLAVGQMESVATFVQHMLNGEK